MTYYFSTQGSASWAIPTADNADALEVAWLVAALSKIFILTIEQEVDKRKKRDKFYWYERKGKQN